MPVEQTTSKICCNLYNSSGYWDCRDWQRDRQRIHLQTTNSVVGTSINVQVHQQPEENNSNNKPQQKWHKSPAVAADACDAQLATYSQRHEIL